MKKEFSPTRPKVWLCRKPKHISKYGFSEEELFLFFARPFKNDMDDDYPITYGPYNSAYFINLDTELFPFVTAENSPFEIDLIELIKMKYENNQINGL